MSVKNCYHSHITHKHNGNHARSMTITTPHGVVETPAFMPVGTRAYVNHLTPFDLLATHSQIILGGNTYHMLVSPGMEVIEAAGGMHHMMNWQHPMLTDSGGFQVFSLSRNGKLCRIDETGAHFKHPVTGHVIHLTARTSISAQKSIGADIIMAFDECTPEDGGIERARAALVRTHRWLHESKEAHLKNPNSVYGHRQALFGIIQGGTHRDLREESTRVVVDMDLDGIAIGGEIIGADMTKTQEIVNWVRPLLPENKVRYTMGVGAKPQDLLDVVACGIDIFDCVAPTRNARHGALYHGQLVKENNWLRFESDEPGGRLLIKKSKYAKEDAPLLANCLCYTCRSHSRAYLHFLFKQNSPLYYQLACIHNVHMMQATCDAMRALIISAA